MKILIDTNVIIDVCEEREPFFQDSLKVFKFVDNNQLEGVVSATAFTDVYYLARKFFQSRERAFEIIEVLIAEVNIVDTLAQDIRDAMMLPMFDFEDAVIAAVARREKAEYIVTRNAADFVNSPVPAITPEAFLAGLKTEEE
jgi:predicted nucleic acid-binding protein